MLPHILGSVGPIYAEEYEELKSQGYGLNDILGKSGLEKSYESFLKGTDGIVQIEKDIYGGITDTDIIKEPVPGNTVQLTVDSDLQEQSNAILRDLVTFLQGRSAGGGKECDGASMVCFGHQDRRCFGYEQLSRLRFEFVFFKLPRSIPKIQVHRCLTVLSKACTDRVRYSN